MINVRIQCTGLIGDQIAVILHNQLKLSVCSGPVPLRIARYTVRVVYYEVAVTLDGCEGNVVSVCPGGEGRLSIRAIHNAVVVRLYDECILTEDRLEALILKQSLIGREAITIWKGDLGLGCGCEDEANGDEKPPKYADAWRHGAV